MNYKNIIQEIQNIQMETFCSLDTFLSHGTTLLPKHKRGLYWIWSSLGFEELKMAINNHQREVPILKLVEQRLALNYTCQMENNGFKVMYNGIGGYKTNPKSFGLRERILQEINSNDHRTGSLNIRNRYSNHEQWAISFFNFDDENNKSKFDFLNQTDAYINHASDLEKLWRIEYGHPILCRH